MTNTPMTFEEWFRSSEWNGYLNPNGAKASWEASQAQQAQTIAELVEALKHYENDVTYDDDILGLRVIKSGEVARQAIAKVKGK